MSSKVKKSKESFLDFLTLEDGTDMLARNVGKGLPLDLHNIPEERRSYVDKILNSE
jgi:hypothetical protein